MSTEHIERLLLDADYNTLIGRLSLDEFRQVKRHIESLLRAHHTPHRQLQIRSMIQVYNGARIARDRISDAD